MTMPRFGVAQESLTAPVFGELVRLRYFSGPATEFWPALLGGLGQLSQAHRAALVRKDPTASNRLQKLCNWSDGTHARPSVTEFNRALAELAEKCFRDGSVVEALGSPRLAGAQDLAIGVRLRFAHELEQCVALFLLPAIDDDRAQEVLVRLGLAADIPRAYQATQSALQTRQDVEKFAAVLDLLTQVNAESRFRAAALAFCNGLASRFHCERCSLGWVEAGFVRLKTISRTERFDKNMRVVKAMEIVMEEAVDQDDEIPWPAPREFPLVTRDHERFAREEGVANIVSVPLRLDDKPVGAVLCERQAPPFGEVELRQFRLAADLLARRLGELRRWDRWFGARWARSARERLAQWVGAEHTWAKVLVLLGALAVVALLLPIYPHRVEGNFILRSEEASYLTAPFDGYIKTVEVRPGDEVALNAVLLRLNTDDLELEEASAVADQTRYLREAEKARASGALAEMRIAQALADQARARLDLVRHRLSQASIQAPFAGVVIEGDLRQRIGAPVRQGEPLFRVARLDPLYVEAEINERDVREVLGRTSGEIAFVAQPKRKYPVRVLRIEPAAIAKEKQNVFLVRCAPERTPESWWRPGMSGVCKLDVERRTLLWILTHRTVDFLRLLLWW